MPSRLVQSLAEDLTTGNAIALDFTDPILEASNVSATVDLPAIPLLPGTKQLLDLGVASTLAPQNWEVMSVGEL